MPDRVDLAELYRTTRVVVSDLVTDEPNPKGVGVPACPGWSVHDVVAHLVGIAEDVEAGRLTGPPTEDQTAIQVARWREAETDEVLAAWEQRSRAVEELLARAAVWPGVIDVLSHEHDVRGALHRPGRRDDVGVVTVARILLRTLDLPVPVVVRCGVLDAAVGPDGGVPALVLTTTPFEVLRFRTGRRSRSQMAAMAWSGDPEPVLDHLAFLGPSTDPVVE